MRVYCINIEKNDLKLNEWYALAGAGRTDIHGVPVYDLVDGNGDFYMSPSGFHRLFRVTDFLTEEEFIKLRDTKINTILFD
jgi:hypothetical protein